MTSTSFHMQTCLNGVCLCVCVFVYLYDCVSVFSKRLNCVHSYKQNYQGRYVHYVGLSERFAANAYSCYRSPVLREYLPRNIQIVSILCSLQTNIFFHPERFFLSRNSIVRYFPLMPRPQLGSVASSVAIVYNSVK